MMANLKEYNDKRDFNNTSEPVGKKIKSIKKHIFVVQHHAARKDHYDFRLEIDGVLKSWAVPKGPSYDTKDKRLAVMVEDHPYSYKDFEGTIPKGEYGGGTVMLWDEGYYESDINIKDGLKTGSLKFRLFGSKLKGAWTLVKFKGDSWLLIKEKDGVRVYDDIRTVDKSVRTGRTMEEIETGVRKIKVKTSKKEHIIEGIEISSPDKVIFERPKVTKEEIALYYKKVAGRMLPYLEDRLLSTIKMPRGVHSEKFFAKHNFAKSDGIVKVMLPSKNEKREDYYHIESVQGLLSEVQMNSYEFHIWGSKASSVDKPDMLVFDLDPDEGMSISQVRQGCRDLKSILDEIGLVSYLKTSGGKGYHIVVPTDKFTSWEMMSEFAENVAKLMMAKWPERYVSNMRKDKRKGKIFIDWVRNTKGATSVAPYSIRLRDKCAVSMPIRWSELDKVKPDEITIDEAVKRLKRKDPWEGFIR